MSLGRQVLRFATVGGVATLVHVAVALALHELARIPGLTANVMAFLVAFGVSYAGNWRWTFAGQGEHGEALPRFLLVAVSGFFLNQSIVFVLHRLADLPFWAALLPAVALVPVLTFWASKTLVFLDRR